MRAASMVSKRLAKRVYQQKLIEWERKKHLKLEAKKEYTFGGLLEWYLDHPRAKRKKTYLRDIEMGRILRENFGTRPAREIKPTDIETFQDRMLETQSKRGAPYKPATVNGRDAMKRLEAYLLENQKQEKEKIIEKYKIKNFGIFRINFSKILNY
jgi:hypothetical protein